MRIGLVSFVVVLLMSAAGAAWALGSRGETPPQESPEKTTLRLIAEALESGEITSDTAVEYRVYAVKAEEELPTRYLGGRPMKDATGVLRQARARFAELAPDVQERLRPYLYPKGR